MLSFQGLMSRAPTYTLDVVQVSLGDDPGVFPIETTKRGLPFSAWSFNRRP